MPLTKEQQLYRYKFYQNAKDNGMFLQNKNMSFQEFNYLLDNVSDYAPKVYDNYTSQGAHLGGSFEAFRQKIGAPTPRQIHVRAVAQRLAKKQTGPDFGGRDIAGAMQMTADRLNGTSLPNANPSTPAAPYRNPQMPNMLGPSKQEQQAYQRAGRQAALDAQQLYRQQNTPIVNDRKNNPVIGAKTEGQFEQEQRQKLNSYLNSEVNNAVAGLMNEREAEGKQKAFHNDNFLQSWLQNLSPGSSFQNYAAKSQEYNKFASPEALWKAIQDKGFADKLAVNAFTTVDKNGNRQFNDIINEGAKERGISPDEYLARYAMPALTEKIANSLQGQLNNKYAVKDYSDYLGRRMTDSVFGTLGLMASTTRQQRQLMEQGTQQYEQGLNGWGKAGGTVASIISQAPEMIATGMGAGALVKGGAKAAGAIIGRMSPRIGTLIANGGNSMLTAASDNIAQRLGNIAIKTGYGMANSAGGMAGFMSVDQMRREISTGEDPTFASVVKAGWEGAKEGAKTGVLFGVAGIPGRYLTNVAGKIGNTALRTAATTSARTLSVATEAGVMTGQEYADWLKQPHKEGEEFDLSGSVINSLAMVATFKGQHLVQSYFPALSKRVDAYNKANPNQKVNALQMMGADFVNLFSGKSNNPVYKATDEDRKIIEQSTGKNIAELGATPEGLMEVFSNKQIPWVLRQKISLATTHAMDVQRPRTDHYDISLDNGKNAIVEYDKDGGIIESHQFNSPEERDAIVGNIRAQRDNNDMLSYIGMYRMGFGHSEDDTNEEIFKRTVTAMGIDYDLMQSNKDYHDSIMRDIESNTATKEQFDKEYYKQAKNYPTRDKEIIAQFAQDKGTTPDALNKIIEKDPLERTDDEQALMSDLTKAMHDDIFRNGELHRNQSRQDGADAAGQLDVTDPEGVGLAFSAITERVSKMQKAWDDLVKTVPELAELNKTITPEQTDASANGQVNKSATPEQVVDAILSSSLPDNIKKIAIEHYSDLNNALAAEDGFKNQLGNRVNTRVSMEAMQNSVTPTSRVEDTYGNGLAGGIVSVTLGETNPDGTPVTYYIKSSTGIRFNGDGTVDRDNTDEHAMIVLMDAEGHTSTHSANDPFLRLINVESQSDFSARRTQELQQGLDQALNPTEQKSESSTEEQPSTSAETPANSEQGEQFNPSNPSEEAPTSPSEEAPAAPSEETPAAHTEQPTTNGEQPAPLNPSIPLTPSAEAPAPLNPSTPFSLIDEGGTKKMVMPSGAHVRVNDGGYPYYSETEPSDVAAYLTNRYTEHPERATRLIDNNIREAQKALDEANKIKPSEAADEETFGREEDARQKAIDDAQSRLDHWTKTKEALGKQNAEKEEQEKQEKQRQFAHSALQNAYDEAKKMNLTINGVESLLNDPKASTETLDNMRHTVEEAIKKENERLAAEANLDGVPDWTLESPADSRKRGFRNVNGVKTVRQGETEGEYGKNNNVKFSTQDTVPTRLKVVEADDLQPSHVGGNSNPSFFITEAQPKDRTDTASAVAAQKIASKVNPSEIIGGMSEGGDNAYLSSAPTVNKRGEVIQGNNRTAALKMMYNQYKDSAEKYKQYIIDHAKELGLTDEQIEQIKKMKKPVIVNEADVSDEEAIRLGQMKAKDLESGGEERIDPVNTARKMGSKMSNLANMLLSSTEEDMSVNDLLEQNGVKAIKWMESNGYISATALQTAIDKSGKLTSSGKADLIELLKHALFEGGNANLKTMFDNMPVKAQRAVLATYTRDFDSPEGERIIDYIRDAIELWHEAANTSSTFAGAKNYGDARKAINEYLGQYHIGQTSLPSEKYSEFAIDLASRFQGMRQKEIQKLLSDTFDLIQGTGSRDMFDNAGNQKMSAEEAVRRIFGVGLNTEYAPRRKRIQANMANEITDNMKANGIDVSTDETEGQQRLDAAQADGEDGLKFSRRTKPAPTKTQKVYKLMRLGEDGKLYPLFIDSSEGIELGKWYDADSPDLSMMKKLPSGVWLIDPKTGKATSLADYTGDSKASMPSKRAIADASKNGMRWVKIEDKKSAQKRYDGESRSYYNIGIDGAGHIAPFAMRPGWHAGSLPTMRQIGKGKGRDLRDNRFVWVEGEVPADRDYNEEAKANPDHDIPDHIPTDGYYMKSTNANSKAAQADRMGWYVAGAFKPDRVISDKEAREVIDRWNAEHPDKKVEYDYKRESGEEFDGNVEQYKNKVYSKDGKKYFRTADGEVYGFVTKDGKIYLDPKHLDPSLPIHEYGHLWAEGVRRSNPKRWEEIVKTINDATEGQLKDLFDEVRKNDPNLSGDDLAEEVLMRYSGKKGMKLLDDDAREIWESGKTTDEKMAAKSAITKVVDNLKSAIREFWANVADMLGIKYRNVDDIADHIIYDALTAKKVDLGEKPNPPKGYTPKYKWGDVAKDAGFDSEISDDLAKSADEHWDEVKDFLYKNPKATRGDIQRKFSLGYNVSGLLLGRYNKENPRPVQEKWSEMSDDEKMDEMQNKPITHEDIDSYDGEDADMFKQWAHDYLNGDHGVQATLGYQTIYDYVRNRRDNGEGDSKAPDAPQLGGEANDGGRPGRGGKQEGSDSGTEGGENGPAVRGAETGADGTTPLPGKGSDKPVRDKPSRPVSGTSGSTRPTGGSGSGSTRPNGSDGGGKAAGGKTPESAADPHAAASAALGDLKNAFSELLNTRKETDKADSKPDDKLRAVTPVYGLLKIGEEVYKRSLGLFMPRNLAETKAYAKVAVAAAKFAYQGLRVFGHDFHTWLTGMKSSLSDTLKQVYPKVTDDDIERYIASYWDTKFKIGDVTHTIGEWSSIMAHEDLKAELDKSIAEKEEAQKKAEGVAVKVGDRANIDETLPFLLPAQRDDVMKAEQQFFSPERQNAEHGYGRGMLFTNGTGTGKTFTGLGIAKRFIKQGKGRILIVTPSAQKVIDWSRDAKHLGIKLTPLDEDAKAHKKNATEWKGDGAIVTTFANFRQNRKLFEDTFDLVIYDESHKIMESKDAKETNTTLAHYRMTNKNYLYAMERMELGHPLWQEEEKLKKEFTKITDGLDYSKDNMMALEYNNDLNKRELDRIHQIDQRIDKIHEEQKQLIPELVEKAQEATKRTKVVFLSATPFNLRENIQYAEGYLFSYGAKTDGMSNEEADREYDKARSAYLRQWFPHGEAFNKNGGIVPQVTDAIKNSEEERAWAEHMKSLGTMSGRTLDNGYDYSRDFPTVNPGMANEYNTALREIMQGKYAPLAQIAGKVFYNYNAMSVIYETMKVSASAERIREHLARGRKVVIFHRRVNDRFGLAEPPFNSVMQQATRLAMQLMATNRPQDQQAATQLMDSVQKFKAENGALLRWEASLDYRMPREQLRSLFGDAHNYTPEEMRAYNDGVQNILKRVFDGQKPTLNGKAVDMTPEEAGYEFGKRCFDPEDADAVNQFAPHRWREGEIDDKGHEHASDETESAYNKRSAAYKKLAEAVRRGIERNIQERINSGEIKIDLDENGKRRRHVGLFAGQDAKGQKDKDIQTFNDDDSAMNIIVVQEASGKEGISLHDTTGKHQRVMVNLALPQSPIAFIQAEGRTYRVGQKSNAIFEYPLLGIDNELMLWGSRFNGRAETTENLALGDEARGLRQAITRGVLTKTGVVPLDGQGVGGREFDTRDELKHKGYDAAVDDYAASQKNAQSPSSLDDVQTPEPLGYKMVEFANMQEGDKALEPSAGDGNISRYIPSNIYSISVEPNDKHYNHLMLLTGGVERGTTEATGRKTLLFHGNFEDLSNGKYDTILMSAPFGGNDGTSTGKLSKAHFTLAVKRLEDSGRLVAIIPANGGMDKFVNDLMAQNPSLKVTGEVELPDFVNTVPSKVVVIDKLERKEMRDKFPKKQNYDLSKATDMNDFFAKLKDVTMPKRTIDPVAKDLKHARSFTSSLSNNPLFKGDTAGLYAMEDHAYISMQRSMKRKIRPYLKSSEYFPFNGKKYYWLSTGYTFDYNAIKRLDPDSLMYYQMARGVLSMTDDEVLRRCFAPSEIKGKEAKYLEGAKDLSKAIVRLFKGLTGRTENELDRAARGEDINNKTPITAGQTLSMDDLRKVFEENNEGDTEQQVLFDKVFALAKTLGMKVSTFEDQNTNTAAFYQSDNTLQINTHFWNAKRYIDSETGDEVVMSPKVRAVTLLHELIHSVTSYADYLYDDYNHGGLSEDLQHDVENLRAVYQALMKHPQSYMLRSRYALKNERELVAEWANPNVREPLKKMGIWTRLKNAILSFFQHSEAITLKNAGVETTQSTIGTELSKILDHFIEHFDMNAYRAFTHTYSNNAMVMTRDNMDFSTSKDDFVAAEMPVGADQHEFVSRYLQHDGLDKTIGHDNYNTLMRTIYTKMRTQGMSDYVRSHMWENKLDVYKTVGQYLAEQATKPGNVDMWQKYQTNVNDALKKAGFNMEVGLRQAKYLAWLAQHPSDRINPIAEAERVAVRRQIMSERIEQPVENGEFKDFPENPSTPQTTTNPSNPSNPQNPSTTSVKTDASAQMVARSITMDKFTAPGVPLPPTATPTQHYAKAAYEAALSRASYIWKEAHIDYMQAAQELTRAILGVKGSLKDKLKENEDFLNGENQLSSRTEAMGKIYRNGFMKPLEKSIQAVLPEFGKKTKDAMNRLQLYMINKSGLERNRVLFMRDWLKALEQSDSDQVEMATLDFKANKGWLDNQLAANKINLIDYFRQLDDTITKITGDTYEPSKHDYSGRMAVYKNGKTTYDDDKAIAEAQAVEDMIGHDRVKSLWYNTEAAARFCINLENECGILSEAQRDYLNDEFAFYVPMRGFDQTMAEDVYSYMTGDYNPKNDVGPTVQNAKGRVSQSNVDIIAQLGAMASRSIAHGLHNLMVNQRFLNFVHNYYDIDGSNRLVTEIKHWIVKTKEPVTGAEYWEESFPKLTKMVNGEEVPVTEPGEVERIVSDWESNLETRKAMGEAKIVSEHDTIPYRFVKPDANKQQHIVVAYQAGKKHILIVNGNPRAAQAINGQLNPTSNGNNPFTKLVRIMSQLVTTYSPDFALRNTARDALFSAMNNFANEGINYWRRYAGNYSRIISVDATKGSFFRRWRKGTLDMNDRDQRLFKEFMDNGGVTGWAGMEDVEKWQKEIVREVKSKKGEALRTAFTLLPNALTAMNEHAENLARFATYMTSRKMGRSITRSIADAKEVSVNFNRKGAGKKSSDFKTPKSGKITKNSMIAGITAQWFRNNIMFYNAGMQGLNTMANNIKNHPIRISEASALFMAMGGFLIPALNTFLQNLDDDRKIKDPYAELPQYLRRQNICIYTGGGDFVTIPMPIELRALYGIGDMIAAHTDRPELNDGTNIALDAASQLTQILPIDFLGENSTPAMSLVPASVKPLAEAGLPPFVVGDNAFSEGLNLKWNGMPIRRKRDSWDANSPAWQRAFASTGDAYVGLAKKLDKLTSDVHSENAKGWLDIDPAQLQHYVTSYTGGIGTTANNVAGLIKEVMKQPSISTIIDSQHTPMLRTLHFTPAEQNRYYRTRSKWFMYKDESDKYDADLKALKQDGYANPLAKAKSISEEMSMRGERNQVMKLALKQYNNLSKVIKATDDASLKDALSLQRDQLMEQTVQTLDKMK